MCVLRGQEGDGDLQMNFEHFDRLLMEASFDEVKVIGRDVELDGHYAHIIGMTLKDKQALVYAFELVERPDPEEELFQSLAEKTHRQQMKDSYENAKNMVFLRVREFHSNGKVYAVAGANTSITENYNMAEHMLFYLMMREYGWKMPEESPLYTADWQCLQMSIIELRDEMEELPDWGRNLEVVKDSHPKTGLLEIPVVLTCGDNPVISFRLGDGTPAECYINKICLKDVWADHERRFQDEEYINKVLERVSMEELQKMKEQCEAALLADCPRGKCYLLVEYECSTDVAVSFYATSHLDAKPKIHSGSATSLLIMHRPDEAKGAHGLKLRGQVIQIPIDADITSLEAELFSYTEIVKQDTEKMY